MDYLKAYTSFLREAIRPVGNLKVIFDCSNGTTALAIKKLRNLEIKKLEFILINDRPDGNFPAHGPNPLAKNAVNDLRLAIRRQKADLGIIFDADGDRSFFLDDHGRQLTADAATLLIAQNFKGPVVLSVNVGFLAREYLQRWKRRVVDSRVGHYFVKQAIRRHKLEFGAEPSGHYYFKKFFYADSGIFSAIQVINQVSKLKVKGQKLSDWVDSLPKHFQSGELNFELTDAKSNANDAKQAVIEKIENKYKKQAEKVSKLDGLKMEFDIGTEKEWWFIARLSNTENLLRLILEARNKKIFDQKLKNIKKMIC